MLIKVVFVLIAYLIGSLSSSVIIGRMVYGIDIRSKGSGNAGATNTFRLLGPRIGIIVLLFDILKGFVAVNLAEFVSTETMNAEQILFYQLILALAVVCGHVFPVFTGFKGGKGVATLLGVCIALTPLSLLFSVMIFIIVFSFTQYVSLGSMLGAFCLPLAYFFLHDANLLPLIIFTIAVAVFIPLTHRKNIYRLVNGEEKKLRLKKGG